VGLREWIVPQEDRFFDLLEKGSANVVTGAALLIELFDNWGKVAEYQKKIEETEHIGDQLVHEISVELNKSFLTPFDHEDISRLAGRIDDIIDYIDAAAQRMWMYKIAKAPKYGMALAKIIRDQVKEIDEAVQNLRRMNEKTIQDKRIRVNALENEADDVLSQALVEDFDLDDLKLIMKHKEIYQFLEEATDRCEDASDILADIVMKNK